MEELNHKFYGCKNEKVKTADIVCGNPRMVIEIVHVKDARKWGSQDSCGLGGLDAGVGSKQVGYSASRMLPPAEGLDATICL